MIYNTKSHGKATNGQTDLFSKAPSSTGGVDWTFKLHGNLTYPDRPGFQNTDTSQQSALQVEPNAATLRAQCLNVLKIYINGLTADEVAAYLNETVLAIRPRITELKLMGFVVDSGIRRPNKSQHKAIVVKITPLCRNEWR